MKRRAVYDDEKKLKKCGMCKEWKPFDDYAKSRGAKAAANGGMQAYCRSCSLDVDRKYKKKNKEKLAAYRKARREQGMDKKKPLTKEQRERRNELHRGWRKVNREKVLMWNRLRVHKARAAGKMPHRHEIGLMLCLQDAKCVYCNKLLDKYHIDHKHPVSRGGTNEIENLQLLCPECNMKKGSMTHEEYFEKLKQAPRASTATRPCCAS